MMCQSLGDVRARVRRWRRASLVVGLALMVPGVAAAAGLTVAWDASLGDVSGYHVHYRAESGGETFSRTLPAAITWGRLEGLQAGQRYAVWVVAFNGIGDSPPSATVTGVASDTIAVPPGATQRFFAEGAAGFFSYRLALLNTQSSPSVASLAFLREGAPPVYRDYVLAPNGRTTISASDIPELNGTSFAASVLTTPGVVAERTMRWRVGGADGAHSAKALAAPSTQWYLAEGNAGYFDTFVLLASAAASTATVTVDFLLDGGGTVSRTYAIAPNQRLTVWTNQIAELQGHSFATTVRSSVPVLVERAMYFRGPNGTWEGGHSSAGVVAGARSWFLAEGSTGNWFETFVLISNPNPAPVTATIEYLTPSGVARTETRTLPAASRTTIPVDSLPGLGSTEVSCSISSSANIIVERSMYWPGVPGPWYGGNNSVGIPLLGTRWALAEGEVGGPDGAETFVLLANPGASAAQVTLTFLRTGGAPVTTTRSVPARARLTVASSGLGMASGELFGVVVTSSQPIAVERSLYWNYLGQLWTSGTNETATPLP